MKVKVSKVKVKLKLKNNSNKNENTVVSIKQHITHYTALSLSVYHVTSQCYQKLIIL